MTEGIKTVSGWLRAHPDTDRYRKYLMYNHRYAPFILRDSIERIGKLSRWDMESVMKGLEALDRHIIKGGAVLPCYTEEEIKEDPGKKDALIFGMEEGNKGPAVIICAGGAYQNVGNMYEGFPTAACLNDMGFDAYCVNYRVGRKVTMPSPLDDLAHAVSVIEKTRRERGIWEGYILCGFSAGGNLICTFSGTDLGYGRYGLPGPLCIWPVYPAVNDSFETGKGASKKYLKARFGKLPDSGTIDEYNVLMHLEDYPPAYIVHSKDDPLVSFEQSLELYRRLRERGIRAELELHETGGHGFALGKGTEAEGWLMRACAFFKEMEKERAYDGR